MGAPATPEQPVLRVPVSARRANATARPACVRVGRCAGSRGYPPCQEREGFRDARNAKSGACARGKRESSCRAAGGMAMATASLLSFFEGTYRPIKLRGKSPLTLEGHREIIR